MGEPILRMQGVTKAFAGFVAVRDLDLDIARGTIHALIGPNGAGKTTVFNLVTKFHQPTSGRIIFKGQDITAKKPSDIARLGMVRSFQISAVFASMSALDNVRVALQRFRTDNFAFWKSDRVLRELDDRARALLNEVGLDELRDRKAAELPYGRRRALELATTLALEPELLLLDEPMAGMGHEDVERTAALIRRVAKDRTVLMVEQNFRFASKIADRHYVMEHGRIVDVIAREDVAASAGRIKAYLGV